MLSLNTKECQIMKSMRFSRLKHVNDIYEPEINIKETIAEIIKITRLLSEKKIN